MDYLDEITVVIPAYNASRTITASIGSVRQALAPALRIIVVDDGSTDDTAAVAVAAGAEVIHQTNQGASVARRRGIESVRTPYLIALDADDILRAGMLDAFHLIRQDVRAAVVGGAVAVMGRDGVVVRHNDAPAPWFTTEGLLANPVSPWPPCAAIWRTSSLNAALSHPIPALQPRYAEDYELLVRASLVGHIRAVTAVTANYRTLGGKSTLDVVAPLRSAEEIRSHYAHNLGLVVEPMPLQNLRELASWRLFRAHQAEYGAPRALLMAMRRPSEFRRVCAAGIKRFLRAGRLRRNAKP